MSINHETQLADEAGVLARPGWAKGVTNSRRRNGARARPGKAGQEVDVTEPVVSLQVAKELADEVGQLRADRDRLAVENAELRAGQQTAYENLVKVAKRAKASAARVRELEAALEPFVPLPPPGNVEEVVTQRPLLTYLAQQKAALEWIAERADLMNDNKNLQGYRAEINDLSRYIESVKALLRPIVARAALGEQAADSEEA